MFLNGTQHLQAPLLAACLHKTPGPDDFYVNLNRWRDSRGMRDEQASDLYARIAEDAECVANLLHRGSIEDLATMLSKHLWASDREFPHG